MNKTISFVMPCFNDGESIERAVESIRDQDLKDIEIVIVNDGSTDDSKKIIDAMKEKGEVDKVIHFDKNQGACVARNEGAKIAEGKYLSFLPADAILYPGMARIWYENLEENPDYDFLYGGYRFIDENEEPIPNHEFLFEPFDPYLLETGNYIDGSFPIRTASFWKFAKIMNQDGLWDPKIKSLQDWDFWLSVVKNGGKGIYVQDIFFGTTIPHPGGLSDDSSKNWQERIEAIKKKHNIPDRKVCVASMGAGFHAKRIAHILNADFKEMPSFKPHSYDALYVIGFYPEFAKQQDSMFLKNVFNPQEGRTPAKKIVHFIGSDIWQLYHLSLFNLKNVWRPYFKNAVDVILCEDEFTRLELQELGIEAKVIPIPPVKLFEPRPLPKDFTVACYLPAVNRDFYQPKLMADIAARLPEVKFKFFGNPAQVGHDPALSPNIEYCGYITDMDAFISECSAIMRFPMHDGLPINVLEFLLAGRYSIQSVPISCTFVVNDFKLDSIVEGIKKIQDISKAGINQAGADFWREKLNHDTFRKNIEQFTKYDGKRYWEDRAKSWTEQASKMPVESEDVKSILEKYPHKSLLDIGCGDGRWYPFLKDWGVEEYHGIDISENLIKAMKLRFPHLKGNLKSCKVEEMKIKNKVDMIFSYTCLEHITEEDFPKAVEKIKKCGDYLLLVEPVDFRSQYYCHNHDYRKHFKVIEEKKLKDKVILLCDLRFQ